MKYQYKIDGLAEWAKKPEFLAAFPYVGQIADDAGKKEQQHGVKLTSVGGEAKGPDRIRALITAMVWAGSAG